MSMSNYLENAFADSLRGGGNGTSFTAPALIYAQLHISDPGEDGTNGVAATTTRQEVQFGAASNGVIALSNAPQWISAAAETFSHISLWTAASGGNCLGSGALNVSIAVGSGDTVNLTSLTFTLT